MKRRTIATVAALALALLLLAIGVAFANQQNNPAILAGTNQSAASEPTTGPTKPTRQMQATTILLGDVEVPIVAGATGVLTWPGGIQNQPPELRYKAIGSTSDIATFYDTNVQGEGWSRFGGYVDETSAGRVYLWTPPDDFPHRLVLSLHALPVGDDGGGRSSVDVNVSVVKWPYATRLPRLPDASNVVTEDQSPDGPYVTPVTTYTTAASVQDVKEFYEREMARSGWSVEYRTPVAGDTSRLLLRFLDPAGGLSEIKYTHVDLAAEPSPDGGTLVTLAAYGPDLPRKADPPQSAP